MINSRDLNELHPAVKRRALAFISACDADGITIVDYQHLPGQRQSGRALCAGSQRQTRPGRDRRQGWAELAQLAAGLRCGPAHQRQAVSGPRPVMQESSGARSA